MMAQEIRTRSKYWWFWPVFHSDKDALDTAKLGVAACLIIAAISGGFFAYNHSKDGDIFGIVGGILIAFVWCFLSYGVYRMSRVASAVALILFIADKVYSIGLEGRAFGILALLFALYLLNAVRATYWFYAKEELKKSTAKIILSCNYCGAPYALEDYSQDASKWFCRQCGKELPRP